MTPESNAKRYWKEKAQRLERERTTLRELVRRLRAELTKAHDQDS